MYSLAKQCKAFIVIVLFLVNIPHSSAMQWSESMELFNTPLKIRLALVLSELKKSGAGLSFDKLFQQLTQEEWVKGDIGCRYSPLVKVVRDGYKFDDESYYHKVVPFICMLLRELSLENVHFVLTDRSNCFEQDLLNITARRGMYDVVTVLLAMKVIVLNLPAITEDDFKLLCTHPWHGDRTKLREYLLRAQADETIVQRLASCLARLKAKRDDDDAINTARLSDAELLATSLQQMLGEDVSQL